MWVSSSPASPISNLHRQPELLTQTNREGLHRIRKRNIAFAFTLFHHTLKEGQLMNVQVCKTLYFLIPYSTNPWDFLSHDITRSRSPTGHEKGWHSDGNYKKLLHDVAKAQSTKDIILQSSIKQYLMYMSEKFISLTSWYKIICYGSLNFTTTIGLSQRKD